MRRPDENIDCVGIFASAVQVMSRGPVFFDFGDDVALQNLLALCCDLANATGADTAAPAEHPVLAQRPRAYTLSSTTNIHTRSGHGR